MTEIRQGLDEMVQRTKEPLKGDRVLMTIQMEVTVPQALTLEAMFEYWNKLGSWGASRYIGFFVDGDGNFKPRARVNMAGEVPELTDHMRQIAVVNGKPGLREADHRQYDFDPIAWLVHGDPKD